MRLLGADEVIDNANEDFTKNGEIYDVIFDAAARGPSFTAGARDAW